jgi:hypothetical protein
MVKPAGLWVFGLVIVIVEQTPGIIVLVILILILIHTARLWLGGNVLIVKFVVEQVVVLGFVDIVVIVHGTGSPAVLVSAYLTRL